jgi:hypothetical protein
MGRELEFRLASGVGRAEGTTLLGSIGARRNHLGEEASQCFETLGMSQENRAQFSLRGALGPLLRAPISRCYPTAMKRATASNAMPMPPAAIGSAAINAAWLPRTVLR